MGRRTAGRRRRCSSPTWSSSRLWLRIERRRQRRPDLTPMLRTMASLLLPGVQSLDLVVEEDGAVGRVGAAVKVQSRAKQRSSMASRHHQRRPSAPSMASRHHRREDGGDRDRDRDAA